MKIRTSIILALAVVLLALPAGNMKAQEKSGLNYGHVISANPIGLALGIFNATYEHRLSKTNSLTVSGYFYSYASSWAAYGVGGSYRWYLNVFEDGKKPIEGLSVGPAAVISFWSYDWDGYGNSPYDGGTSIAIGGEAAYKWIFGSFSVEPLFQLLISLVDISGLSYQSWGLGVNLGYAW